MHFTLQINLNKMDTFLSFPFVPDCNANVHKGCKDAASPCTKVISQSCVNVTRLYAACCFMLSV